MSMPDNTLNLAAIADIDAEQGLRRFANKKDLYVKSLLSFASDIPGTFADFASFYNEENKENSAKYVHTLKGVAGNLSINSMYQKTIEIEMLMKDASLTEDAYNEWTAVCLQTKENILGALKPANDPKCSLDIGSKDECMGLINELRQALDDYKTSRCDELVDLLKAKNWNEISAGFFNTLLEKIDDYDYDGAIECIDNL